MCVKIKRTLKIDAILCVCVVLGFVLSEFCKFFLFLLLLLLLFFVSFCFVLVLGLVFATKLNTKENFFVFS